MRFKIGDEVVVRSGSILDFKENHSYDYSGSRGKVINFNSSRDGYVVKFDSRTMSSFSSDHMKFIRDNYTNDDRVIFYDKHLDIYVKSWKDNLRDSWAL